MDLNEFAVQVHENSESKGWWKEKRPYPEIVAMCHSELSESLTAYRDNLYFMYYKNIETGLITVPPQTEEEIAKFKPEGLPIELIDCILRILDYMVYEGYDVEELLKIKHRFNCTRP